MSYINEKTLIVAFLSSHPILRAYELDLLQELDRKNLGLLKLVVGEAIPHRALKDRISLSNAPAFQNLTTKTP
jgi:tagatose-6-phosphate ketose/aldose isomerase